MIPLLAIEDVDKVYESKRGAVSALSAIDVEVDAGEFVCLLGPSGCGKSSLLRMIAGLESITSGRITLHDAPVHRGDHRVVMVWQDFALMGWRTVRANVEFGLEVRGMSRAKRRERSDAMISLVGLGSFQGHYPSELSGGMRQRVGLARALAVDPEVLLMDEPFGALDAQTRLLMQEQLLSIWEQAKKTIVFVTHSIEEAILLADRIVVFTKAPGRVKEVVPVTLPRPRIQEEIRENPSYNSLYKRLYRSLHEESVF